MALTLAATTASSTADAGNSSINAFFEKITKTTSSIEMQITINNYVSLSINLIQTLSARN